MKRLYLPAFCCCRHRRCLRCLCLLDMARVVVEYHGRRVLLLCVVALIHHLHRYGGWMGVEQQRANGGGGYS